MANTLTNLIPTLYAAADVVSREMVGFIPAVTLDANAERAAIGQAVVSAQTSVGAATDITSAVTPPDDGDQTIGNTSITITKARRVPVRWNGEQSLGVNSGSGVDSILRDQFAQAMRILTNEVEADLAALYVKACRAYGTAGTTPFASDLSDPAQMRKILIDNGAPLSDLQMVINTTAGAKLRSLATLNKANEAGSDALRSQGILLDLHGFMLRESAQVKTHTKGTGTAYQTNLLAGYAIGDTSIAVDTGSGAVVAGDILTFNGDSNKYVNGSALAAGSLVLNKPGLLQTLANDVAMTVGNNYTANMAFARSAIGLAARAPALPKEGDSAVDRMLITDPVSGLTFEISMYAQYRQIQYEIALAWGVACNKPEHCAILLG